MRSKSDLIRLVLADMPDASAPDVMEEVAARYGVDVAVGSVRAVKSRDGARGGVPGHTSAPYQSRRGKRPAINEGGYGTSGEPDDYKADPGYGYRAPSSPPARVRPDAAPRRPERVPPPAAAEFAEDQEEAEFFALIDQVENAVRQATAGHMQQVTGSRELVQTIVAIADDPELRAANRPFRYEVVSHPDGSQSLRLYADKPVSARPAKRSAKRKTEPGCEWCGRPVPGVSLYLVHGGALGPRPRILCQMHAEPEVRAGANVTPYRVFADNFGGRAAVIVPAKTPMQALRERVIQSADSYLGIEQPSSENS